MCLSISTACFGQQSSDKNYSQIDAYIKHLIDRQGIPGVALAITKGDQILYKKNFGYANLEHQVPVTDQSIFRLYSLTKPVIAVSIFQLVEERKLSLDEYVSSYAVDLPETWKHIKIKHLLSHSSGLPDIAPIPDFKDLSEEEAIAKVLSQEIKFSPGERFDYNQTGFWLLQKIIENVTGEKLSDFVLKNQFRNADNTFFSSDSRDIVLNRATPYFPFEKGTLMIDHSYLQGTYAYSKNGLNTTLNDFIEWNRLLNNNYLIDEDTKDSMWKTFSYSASNRAFTYGWDKHTLNGNVSYGFSGSLSTAYRIFPNEQLSIYFFSNGLSKWYNIENAINHIAYLVDAQLVDVNNLAFESLLKSSFEHNSNDFVSDYKKIKKHPLLVNNNFEIHLNDVGYFWLLALGNLEKAIEVFIINTKEYPDSWNTYDSLAAAYERSGNLKEAVRNYQKAIELNTDQQYNATTMAKIEQLSE